MNKYEKTVFALIALSVTLALVSGIFVEMACHC